MAPVDVQVYQFSVMVIAGVAVGVMYDTYRVFRLMTRPGQWATAIYDTVFWAMSTLLVLAAVFYASWGEVRVYVFIGLAGGAFLYFRLGSPLVLRLFRGIWAVVAQIIVLVSRVFHDVVVLPLTLIVRVILRILLTLSMPFVALSRLVRFLATSIGAQFKKPPEAPPEN